MAGKPLYLVRRELYRFIGPMTLPELRAAYRKMEVGPQDEVCGHCGPWIPLDQVDRLRARYPEVANLVGDENSAGWAVSDHGSRRLSESSSRGKSGRRAENRADKVLEDIPVSARATERDNPRRLLLAGFFLSLAVVAGGVAWVIVRGAQSGGGDEAPLPRSSDAAAFLQKNDMFGFMAFIDSKSSVLIPRVLRSRSVQAEWLPYLRVYAFSQQGQVPGIPARVLRGDGFPSLPQDCSVSAWTQRWTQSMEHWSSGAAGSRFSRTPWMQILAWDPHYVARRRAEGWITQRNYMEACLVMAAKSLDEVAANVEKDKSAAPVTLVSMKVMRRRLQWQIDVTQGRFAATMAPVAPRDALEALTCMESAGAMDALNRCRDFKPATEGWTAVMQSRYAWSYARLVVPKAQRGDGPASLRDELSAQLTRMAKPDGLTGLDEVEELALVREVARRRVPSSDDVLRQKDAGIDVDLRGLAGFDR